MRMPRGPLALTALALVLLSTGGRSERLLTLDGPTRQTKETIGLLFRGDGARLARIDMHTLRPVAGRSTPLGFVDAWAFARPSGNLLALATHAHENSTFDAVRLVELHGLRLVKRAVPLPGIARALLWARLDRLVAVVHDCCSPAATVVTIDTGSRRVLVKQELAGDVQAVARAADALVLLETPHNEIGASRLSVVSSDGTVRSTPLDRVVAGTTWPADGSDPIGTTRLPALAVDPAAYRAHVVQPDGPAAEVDLRSLAVTYHDLAAPRSALARLSSWLMPSAAAKGLNGPRRVGRWLGDGLLAVTGTDEVAREGPDGQRTLSGSPAGLAIVDVRDWTIETLDAGADAVTAADGLLLVTGSSYSSQAPEPKGMGLAVYGPDRKLRFRLFQGTSSWVQAALGGRAYVGRSGNGSLADVVDLETGQVVEQRDQNLLPTPLLADGPDY
jgi:hypothetical protein